MRIEHPGSSLAVTSEGTWAAAILDAGWSRQEVPDRIVLCAAKTGKIVRRWSDSGRPSAGYEPLAFSPDGRILASADEQVVHLWETATGKEIHTLRGQRGEMWCLTFSADHRRLATASRDNTVLIWDLPRLARSVDRPGNREAADWWADLRESDAPRAQAAIWRLAAAPEAALPLLRQHLKPITEADLKDVHKHIAALDSDTFAVREKASQTLADLGTVALPGLQRALQEKPSVEVQRRIRDLLDRLNGPPDSGESLRTWRALAVLEYMNTPESRRLLQALANGVPEAWLTQESRAALRRLAGVK